jgi:hypothetical protein
VFLAGEIVRRLGLHARIDARVDSRVDVPD